MAQKRIKVLYILGMTRSGTTILDRILGNIDGFFSLGEFYTIWDQYFSANRECGCEKAFRSCPLWQAVFNDVYGGFSQLDPKNLLDIQSHYFRTRHIPYSLLPGYQRWLNGAIPIFRENMEKLYQAVHRITSSTLIIDSSKLPSYAYAVNSMDSIEAYYVHLIRDPRGVAYSWLKTKTGRDGTVMEKMHPVFSAGLWTVTNLASESFLKTSKPPYLRIRYEDFIQSPQSTIQEMIALTGIEPRELPFKSEREVKLLPNHNLEGNPNRFQSGLISLNLDDSWLTHLSPPHQRMINSLTWPLLKRYHYPFSTTTRDLL